MYIEVHTEGIERHTKIDSFRYVKLTGYVYNGYNDVIGISM